MNKSPNRQLAEKLLSYEKSGISFFEAKQRLIAEGYSEHDITIIAASQPYDGIIPTPPAPHPDIELIKSDPVFASAVAQATLITASHQIEKFDVDGDLPYIRSNSPSVPHGRWHAGRAAIGQVGVLVKSLYDKKEIKFKKN